MTEVRTRIAPSPTGTPHIGTAYIALFNLAFARRHGGSFVLRVEDTDRTRSTAESEREIVDALRWLGLNWNEGPDVGGPCAPYRQSERTDIYRRHVEELIEQGAAYHCFCTADRLRELRARQEAAKAPLGYDGTCAALPTDDVRQRLADGEPSVVRMKIPAQGECVFHDRLRGEIRIPWTQVDHQVLLKSDGFPTYHLANVVDDHLMRISHVIRGEEWISSTPKHVLLYQLFGWTVPEFIHLPLLRNPDKTKLSKRKNPTSILYYRRAGFLPEALVNYMASLAYSMPDGREQFLLSEFCEQFDMDRVSLGGPIFDPVKLKRFNGRCIRELGTTDLLQVTKDWILNDEMWLRVLHCAKPRIETLSDLLPSTAFLFADELDYEASAILSAHESPEQILEWLKIAQWEFERSKTWDKEGVRSILEKLALTYDLPIKRFLPIFFIAVSGRAVSLPLFESLELLGREMSVRRLQYAVDKLARSGHTLSKKKLKELSTEYG